MKNTKYTDLIGRHLTGHITASESAELMAWVKADSDNQAFFDEMVRLWSVSEEYEEAAFVTDVPKARAAFDQKFEQRFPSGGGNIRIEKEEASAKIHKMRPLRLVLQYAAAVLLLVAAGYWFLSSGGEERNQNRSFHTEAGEQRELQLPDGSTVVLNENSELAYAKPFEKREIQLSGEAFFQVKPLQGKSFTIASEGAATTVLGTSFNVRAYPAEEKVEVSVKTGKVALQKAEDNQQKVILEAGEAAAYNKEKKNVEKILVSNADSWNTGHLNFDSVPLKAVVKAMERYFDTDIEVANPKLLNCSFKGQFKQPALKDILDALAFTMMLEVEKKNGAYILHGDAAECD